MDKTKNQRRAKIEGTTKKLRNILIIEKVWNKRCSEEAKKQNSCYLDREKLYQLTINNEIEKDKNTFDLRNENILLENIYFIEGSNYNWNRKENNSYKQ
ncbi:hypothetical protein C1645_837715 [Glomus cerebriforme]|uniref:Uncharacterized protein n=1 Tax=Glomus cerebriforme TaxID=658196 RepID=A0A397S8B6_9GLOM|nr:hypothetical protein C1645_837715 [Glomus cerebriforme]